MSRKEIDSILQMLQKYNIGIQDFMATKNLLEKNIKKDEEKINTPTEG